MIKIKLSTQIDGRGSPVIIKFAPFINFPYSEQTKYIKFATSSGVPTLAPISNKLFENFVTMCSEFTFAFCPYYYYHWFYNE